MRPTGRVFETPDLYNATTFLKFFLNVQTLIHVGEIVRIRLSKQNIRALEEVEQLHSMHKLD